MADLERTVTPELALAAAAVIKEFCMQRFKCDECVLDCVGPCNNKVPELWKIPERKKDGDL